MTVPLPSAPHPNQLAIELAAAARVAGQLKGQLQEATRKILAAYVVYAGSLNNPIPQRFRAAFTAAAGRVIAVVAADIRQPLWEMVWRALVAGQQIAYSYLEDALEQLPMYGQAAFHEAIAGRLAAILEYGQPAVETAQWAGNVVHAAQARLDAALISARDSRVRLPEGEISFADVLAALAPLAQAVTDLERDTKWAVNAAFNQAARDIAEMAGLARMWIAERDACLHCLALSGQIAQTGQPYDSNLTFYVGEDGNLKPMQVYPRGGPLWGPPRHPNCRCHQIPVPVLDQYPVMPWETRAYHPSEALQREARRAVLRGDSGTESLPARLRATDALLMVGARLPRSVEARARAAVRAGRYPRRGRV